MAAKNNPANITERGAPAALSRLEQQELDASIHYDAKKSELERLRSLPVPKTDKLLGEHRRMLDLAYSEFEKAAETHHAAAKILLSFDKQIAPEKREGEKITVAEAKEYFRQYHLSMTLGLELYIGSIAQAAALCNSPEEFHAAHATNIRSAVKGAISKAQSETEGVLPKWIDLE